VHFLCVELRGGDKKIIFLVNIYDSRIFIKKLFLLLKKFTGIVVIVANVGVLMQVSCWGANASGGASMGD
jgi:hypothetical protein